MAKMFRKAHAIQASEQNDMAWLQGFYVYQAVAALAPALRAFSKGRAHRYMDKPIEFGHNEFNREVEQQERKKKETESNNKAKAILEMWAVNFNEKWDKKEQEEKEKETTAMNGGETVGRDSRN